MHTKDSCQKSILAIRDTLDVVGGKWKLVLIIILISGKRRFRELVREAGITPRILSKELQEMEMNGLITRTVQNTKPITVEYAITDYGVTLVGVLEAMDKWGNQHRKKIIGGSTVSHP
jgi:DNA-binding HxlR family transcriptional regulator